MNEEFVLVTILISYLCKKTNEPKYSHVKVQDCYPSLINTNHVLNFARSNDRYEVLSKEYSLEEAHFTDIDLELCNTVH